MHHGLSAQMITTAITVGSDGAIVFSAGATYGILVAILIFHGIVCSAATRIVARLNLAYVVINGDSPPSCLRTYLYPITPSWDEHRGHYRSIGLLRVRAGLGEGCIHFIREQHRMG
jgi:hypothetical protein